MEDSILYHIYKLTNTKTGMSYIGMTKTTVKARCAAHRNNAQRGMNYPICEAIRADGWDAFAVEELGRVETKEEAYSREKAAIVLFNAVMPTGYNQGPVVQGCRDSSSRNPLARNFDKDALASRGIYRTRNPGERWAHRAQAH